MKRNLLVVLIASCLVLAGILTQPTEDLGEVQQNDANMVRIGVVTPTEERHPEYTFLTKLAENEINKYCENQDIPLGFEFVIVCADSDSMKALEHVQGFYGDDIRIVLGLAWTTQLCVSRGFGETRDMIFMSTGSSGSHLRFEDHCFRLYPYTGYQAKPLITALRANEIENLLIVKSQAEYNQDILDELMPLLDEEGIHATMFEADHMDNDETAKYFTDLASKKLDEILVNGSTHNTGVLMMSYESVRYLKAENSSLLNVIWFGSDMMVNDSYIRREAPGAASTVSLVSPQPAVTKSPEYERANELFRAEFHTDMDYSYANMYDSCWIIAKTIIETNSTDYDTLLDTIPAISEVFGGASGLCELDEYGDRLHSQYDIYEYQNINGKISSIKIGEYDSETDRINWAN